MEKNCFLSIITPTYNRGHLLPECYASLRSQDDPDFEWIIVDDGSTDDTAALVGTFSRDLFDIVYVPKENGGKHTALNASHPHIRGEYVLILDSDDTLTSDAVSAVRKGWEQWSRDPGIAIVTFLKGASPENPNCTGPIANEPVDILRYKRTILHSTDCCEVIRSQVFKAFPFPVFEGERFLSEGVLWNRVALNHRCVYINRVIYICEYLEGGLTKSGRAMRIRNPLGGMLSSLLCMHPKNYLSRRIKNGLLYCSYGCFAKHSPSQLIRRSGYPFLSSLCMLPGWLLYLYWNKKYG